MPLIALFTCSNGQFDSASDANTRFRNINNMREYVFFKYVDL